MLKLKVTSIQYDFQCDDNEQVSKSYQKRITSQTIGKVYEVEREDELADAISDETGWCVKSLKYEVESEDESDDASALAHEIWAVSQLAPEEGILDAVDRIIPLLSQWKSND